MAVALFCQKATDPMPAFARDEWWWGLFAPGFGNGATRGETAAFGQVDGAWWVAFETDAVSSISSVAVDGWDSV